MYVLFVVLLGVQYLFYKTNTKPYEYRNNKTIHYILVSTIQIIEYSKKIYLWLHAFRIDQVYIIGRQPELYLDYLKYLN